MEPSKPVLPEEIGLKLEEQRLKNEELRQRIDDAKKPALFKLSNLTTVATVALAIAGFYNQHILSDVETKQAQLNLQLAKLELGKARHSVDSAQNLFDSIRLRTNKYELRLNKIKNLYIASQQKATIAQKKLKETEKQTKIVQANLSAIKQKFKSYNGQSNIKQKKDINSLINSTERIVNDLSSSSTIVASPTLERPKGQIPLPPLNSFNDSEKGKWGMHSEVNSRRITASVTTIREGSDSQAGSYNITITVLSTDPAKPLSGNVIFHLDKSYRKNSIRTIRVVDNKAVLTLYDAYGSFTVGAEADGGATRLELDLAELPGVSEWFRNN